ncbi:MAG: trigger factor [Treponema sp.]|nr:trigger factor [Treponema sp.]
MELTTEFTPLEKSAVKLTVTVAQPDVQAAYDSTLKKYMKSAFIPGFRKGHVPAHILERKYGDGIKADVTGSLIDSALNELFEDKDAAHRPLPYAQPQMDTVPELNVTQPLTFTVTYDVFPTVTVSHLADVVVQEPQVTIGDKEIASELAAIQERNAAVMDKKDDELVEKDNIVTVTYCECGDDGKEIAGTKREDFTFTVGSGQNIYKIDDDIIGMKKGERRTVTKTYPDDAADKDLAGTTKTIDITVTQIKTRTLPAIDDELAQDVSEKYQTLDDMKKDIVKNLERSRDRRVREIKNNDLLSQLIEKNPFEIPASMLQAELNGRWQMMARQFQTTPDQLDKIFASDGQLKENMFKEWEGESEKLLKSRIIVDSLLRARNITVTPEELEAQYQKIADERDMDIEEVKKHYADARSKEYLIDETKEQKLYDELYKEVTVKKGAAVSFDALFHYGEQR